MAKAQITSPRNDSMDSIQYDITFNISMEIRKYKKHVHKPNILHILISAWQIPVNELSLSGLQFCCLAMRYFVDKILYS